MMDAQQVKNIIEACLLVAGKAMSLRQLDELFEGDEGRPDKETIKTCVEQLQADYEGRGIELVQVASGYRLQSRTEVSEWVARLFPEKPPRYSRALLETLVLVAYRQPITRGEIEEIRGVAVSSNIVKTLQERQWVKEVGFKDVPGKPALLGTTKHFLDYFNLKRLDDLPPLSDVKNLDEMDAALMEAAGIAPAQDSEAANDGEVTDVEASVNTDGSYDENVAEASVEDEAIAEAAFDDSTPEASEISADSELTEDELEQTSFVAGAANSVSTEQDSESTTAGAAAGATDGSDVPVTFAGLVSDLSPLDEAASEGGATVSDDESEETASSPTADELSASSNTDDTQSEEHGVEALDDSPTTQPDEEQKLYNKLSEYAEESQGYVEARNELDNQLQTRYIDHEDSEAADHESPDDGGASTEAELVTADADEHENSSTADSLSDAIEASSSSSSIDVLSETFTGDSPSVGETLH